MRPARRVALIVIGLAPLVLSRPTASQGARSGNGVILGTVTDSALQPVADAEVSFVASRVRVTADGRGRFQIVDVPSGDYLLMVRRLGHRSVTASVTIHGGDTLRLAFMLEPSVAEMAPVTVTEPVASSRLREFQERRKGGAGQFFDQQYIDARNVVSVTDILREAKGVRLVTEGGKVIAMSARQWTRCPMQVYVDGIPLAAAAPGASSPFDLTLLPSPKEIMGIEVYSGVASEPLWLPSGPTGAKRSCGALLVWTRDG